MLLQKQKETHVSHKQIIQTQTLIMKETRKLHHVVARF